MITFDFDLDPPAETAIIPSTVHPPESIFPIRRLWNIGSSAWLPRKGIAKGRRGNESGKHYNKSAGLWRECKIAGTDLVVYNTRGLVGDQELANCEKGGGRERGWPMGHCESYLSCWLRVHGRGEKNRRSARGGRSYWPIIDGYCLY